ncbi:MAG: GldG family protein [Deltaproteobacteria bacterium]|nr:GldG family protein [Deltaproteobacteria bacterium]
MRILSIILGVVGSVVLLTCLLTVFFFPLDSWLLWGKVAIGLSMLVVAIAVNWRGVGTTVAKRSTVYVLITTVVALGLLALLGAVNYLANMHRVEIDLTRERIFTLADQSQQLAEGIDQPVTVTAFFRNDEPEALVLTDLVERYRLHSDKIALDVVDPDRRPELVEKYNVKADGPRIIVGAGAQEARIREPTEEALTNALLQVTQTASKPVYFLIGHGESGIQDQSESGYQATADDLTAEGYAVQSLNLVDSGKIPTDAGLIAVPGPRNPLLGPELEQLASYLERGGKLLLLLEPDTDPGLADFLARYQIGYRNDTILDASPYGRLFGMGPDAAIVFTYEEHAITRDLGNMMTIFSGARSLQTPVDGPRADAAVQARAIFSSTPRSWGETDLLAGNWELSPGEAPGPLAIAVVATKNTSTVATDQKLADEMRLVVVGDSSFGDNRYRTLQANRDLFLNIVAWLTEQENKIAIRPRQRGASRVVLGPDEEALIAFVAIDALPVTLLSLGLGIWLARRRR